MRHTVDDPKLTTALPRIFRNLSLVTKIVLVTAVLGTVTTIIVNPLEAYASGHGQHGGHGDNGGDDDNGDDCGCGGDDGGDDDGGDDNGDDDGGDDGGDDNGDDDGGDDNGGDDGGDDNGGDDGGDDNGDDDGGDDNGDDASGGSTNGGASRPNSGDSTEWYNWERRERFARARARERRVRGRVVLRGSVVREKVIVIERPRYIVKRPRYVVRRQVVRAAPRYRTAYAYRAGTYPTVVYRAPYRTLPAASGRIILRGGHGFEARSHGGRISAYAVDGRARIKAKVIRSRNGVRVRSFTAEAAGRFARVSASRGIGRRVIVRRSTTIHGASNGYSYGYNGAAASRYVIRAGVAPTVSSNVYDTRFAGNGSVERAYGLSGGPVVVYGSRY